MSDASASPHGSHDYFFFVVGGDQYRNTGLIGSYLFFLFCGADSEAVVKRRKPTIRKRPVIRKSPRRRMLGIPLRDMEEAETPISG